MARGLAPEIRGEGQGAKVPEEQFLGGVRINSGGGGGKNQGSFSNGLRGKGGWI